MTRQFIVDQFLALQNCSSGAIFRAVDLHIHTPASKNDYKICGQEYEKVSVDEVIRLAVSEGLYTKEQIELFGDIKPKDKDAITAELIVHKAIQQKLSMIAITDHNIIDENWYKKILKSYYEYIRRKNIEWQLCILPGIEITAYGGNHIIGIFDPENYKEAWNKLINDLNLDKELFGQDGPICDKSELEIIKCINDNKGITYIPHIDTRSEKLSDMLGDLSGKSKIKLFKDPNLIAVGFSVYERHVKVKEQLNNKSSAYYREYPLAYLRDSDAHCLEDIGTKPIYLKLDQLNYTSLKLALKDPELRVSCSETSAKNAVYFIGMAVNGGWLKKEGQEWQYIKFSPDLNTIIGGRGTGKSTVLNLLKAAISKSTRDHDYRDFIARFNKVLVYFWLEGNIYCACIEPKVYRDPYTEEPIYSEGRRRSRINSIENWVNVYKIHLNRARQVYETNLINVTQADEILKRVTGEQFEQTEILKIATNQQEFNNFFDRIVKARNPQSDYASLLNTRSKLAREIRSIGFTITNSNSLKLLDQLKEKYEEVHSQIKALRENTVHEINKDLEGCLTLKVEPKDIQGEFIDLLDNIIENIPNAKKQNKRIASIISSIGKHIPPTEFVKLIVSERYAEIKDKAQIGELEAETFKEVEQGYVNVIDAIQKIGRYIIEKGFTVNILELLEDDKIALAFNTAYFEGDSNRRVMRSLHELSLGQKAVAILTLILKGATGAGNSPLIIDQPEDHLDNNFIYSNLVTSLRELKGKRQIILVTHNPNVVVASDSDQVICMASDGTQGWVEMSGSIDRKDVLENIINILEGGMAALMLRINKYRISGLLPE